MTTQSDAQSKPADNVQVLDTFPKWDAALREHLSLAEPKPITAKHLDRMGRESWKAGKAEDAAHYLGRAIEMSNSSLGCLKIFGLALQKLDRKDDYCALVENHISRDDLTVRQTVSLADLMSRDPKFAKQSASILVGSSKADREFHSNGLEKISRQSANTISKVFAPEASSDTDESPNQFDQNAQDRFKLGDYEGAAYFSRRAYEESGKTVISPKVYGLALAKLGREDEKQELIDQLFKQENMSSRQSVALADLMSRDEKWLDHIDAVLARLTPAETEKFEHGLGKIYAQAKRSRKSQKVTINAALVKDSKPISSPSLVTQISTANVKPSQTESHMDIADLLAKSQHQNKVERDLSAALKTLRLAESLASDQPVKLQQIQTRLVPLEVGVGLQQHRQGEIDAATASFERAGELVQDDYVALSKIGAFFAQIEAYERAEPFLMRAHPLCRGNKAGMHVRSLCNCLTMLHRWEDAHELILDWVSSNPDDRKVYLETLADIASGLKDHQLAADYLTEAMTICEAGRVDRLARRRDLHALYSGQPTDIMTEELNVCQTYFERNLPQLDAEQTRILEEVTDRGICMTNFDALFGEEHENLWTEAAAFVETFENRPEIRDLRARITECEDFAKDPNFSKMFKPSIINYRQELGEMYAHEAPYQLYQNKRILDIANSYHGMLSKIRNVALWINPEIGGKNIGTRKGSQIWHRDQEDRNILKCFIYYTDVDEDTGATEYVPFSKSVPDRRYSDVLPYPYSSGYPGSFLMDRHVNIKDRMAAVGKRRSIMFFDTNGFHRGGYVTRDRRILTMATYLRPITPYAKTNTRLSIEGTDMNALPFEASYGLKT